MKATPADQRALLDVADVDRSIRQADHARRNPPQAARIAELTSQRTTQSHELSVREGARDDIQTELSRLESDVQLAKTRRDRDAERLAASTNPKDAQALEHEIASLDKRLSDLEDIELEVMQRLEDADNAVAEQRALIDETNREGSQLTAEAKQLVADSTARIEQLGRDRAALVGALSAELVARYDKLAERGTGAALLTRGMCGGCTMLLAGTDLQKVREAAADEVVFCPECGCILVRTEESGL